MKTKFHQWIVRSAVSVAFATSCALVAQTAPSGSGGAPAGGTGGTTGGTRTGGTTTAPQSGATTTAPGGTTTGGGAQPAAAGNQPVLRNQLPNQPAQPTPGQPKPPQPAIAPGSQPAPIPGQLTTPNSNILPGTNTTRRANVAPDGTQSQTTTPGATTPGTQTQTTTPGTTTTTNQATVPGTNTTTTPTQNQTTAPTRGLTSTTTQPDNSTVSTGTIGNLTGSGFTLTDPSGRQVPVFISPATTFFDVSGNAIPRTSVAGSFRSNRTPATIYYTQEPNGTLTASRVVMNEAAPATTEVAADAPVNAGTVTEVSPGILVIEQPGASDTPVRYVNNKTTNYVNENGEPVAPESVKAGTPVKIYYTKVGDTLVASRVEVVSSGKGGLPAPKVESKTSTTTTTTKEEK